MTGAAGPSQRPAASAAGSLVRLVQRLRALRNLWLAFVVAGLPFSSAAEGTKEYDVKAALVYNFTQFVEWPPVAFDDSDGPVIIGIIGRNPFGETLEKVVEPERAAGRRIVVQQCRTMAEATRCHILFIGQNERDELQQILRGLGNRPILTIAEFGGFLSRGGMVRLYRNADSKVRIRINLESVRNAGLTMSAKLLRVVEVVSENED